MKQNGKTSYEDFGFAFTIRPDGKSARIEVVAQRFDKDDPRCEPHGISSLYGEDELDGLQISTWLDEEAPHGVMSYRYEIKSQRSLTNDRMKRVSKVLGKIDKGMEAARRREGRPLSFGQYVARVANALGFGHMWTVSEDSGRWIEWDKIGEAAETIDRMISDETARLSQR